MDIFCVTQKDTILILLKTGNSFTEQELTKAITRIHEGYYDRGARSLIHILRHEGYPIASKNVVNQNTGRLNKSYYWETDKSKYVQWCFNNGYFEFKKGAPR